MNSLRDYIAHRRIDATHALNLLQDAGVISDLFVPVAAVGDAGTDAALLSLHANEPTTAKL